MTEKTKRKKSTLSESQKNFLMVYDGVGGNISMACRQSNVKSRTTFYRWLEIPEFKDAVDDVDESFIDLAESQLRAAVARGDLNAVFFLLKTKGKSRGYVEKTENEVKIDGFTKLLEGLD